MTIPSPSLSNIHDYKNRALALTTIDIIFTIDFRLVENMLTMFNA